MQMFYSVSFIEHVEPKQLSRYRKSCVCKSTHGWGRETDFSLYVALIIAIPDT